MYSYFLKRLLLVIPTLFIILLVNFLIIQSAPGGPVERFLAQINHEQKAEGEVINFDNKITINATQNLSKYRGANGVDPEIISKIEKLYGFDLPLWQRFWEMLKKFLTFDFGESFYQDKKITDMILEKLPVSISLGLWSMLLVYGISIPLGIKKAVKDGSQFDLTTSSIIIFLYAVPAFLFAVLLIALFCGGNFLNIFPLKGLVSQNFSELTWWQKIADYFWHIFLPIIAITIGGFASLTFFVKNSFIEEIRKQYVLSAAAKGLNQKQILYRHVFRNAMLIIIAGLPASLLSILFSSSMLIEIIFSLDGLGLMGYEAVLSRDYSVIFATLYIFTILGLVTNIITDLTYKIIDPRINFNKL
jgi:microcin C transport system permease protein